MAKNGRHLETRSSIQVICSPFVKKGPALLEVAGRLLHSKVISRTEQMRIISFFSLHLSLSHQQVILSLEVNEGKGTGGTPVGRAYGGQGKTAISALITAVSKKAVQKELLCVPSPSFIAHSSEGNPEQSRSCLLSGIERPQFLRTGSLAAIPPNGLCFYSCPSNLQ